MKQHHCSLLALSVGVLACTLAMADEAAIRKNLPERLGNLPPIEEVTKTEIPGLYEVRLGGSEIIYSDEQGSSSSRAT